MIRLLARVTSLIFQPLLEPLPVTTLAPSAMPGLKPAPRIARGESKRLHVELQPSIRPTGAAACSLPSLARRLGDR